MENFLSKINGDKRRDKSHEPRNRSYNIKYDRK